MINLLEESINVRCSGIFAIILGSSGSGKSHCIGTHPGRVLLLHSGLESHGPSSAIKSATDRLIAVRWDRSGDADLKPDDVLPRIKSMLQPDVLKAAGIDCIAIDSLTALCLDIKRTSVFKQRVTDAKGNINQFKETEAIIEILAGVTNQLLRLHEQHGIDVVATMDLQINRVDERGDIVEARPGVPTYGVGKALVQQFPDVLVVNRRQFDMGQNFQITSKDRETKQVQKYVEFSPRLRGVNELPESISADLREVLKLKGGVK